MNDPDLNNFERKLVPPEFYLGQNYPNPFSEKTTIKYCVAYKIRVQIAVYNTEGEEIEKLVDEEKSPGTYEVEFSASPCHSCESRNPLEGYYFYRMTAGDFTSEKKWLCINKLSGRLNMKNLLQTLFFFLLVTQICFAQWYQQNSGITKNLRDVAFLNANIGIAVGDSGTILRTTNGGAIWTLITNVVTNDFTGMCFIDANNVWIVAGDRTTDSFILHTSDGGVTWSTQLIRPLTILRDITFIDPNNGWVVGGFVDSPSSFHSFILRTTNGGITWNQTINDTIYGNKVYFIDENNGWILDNSTWHGRIFRTTDGGDTWALQFETTNVYYAGLNDIVCFDLNKAFAVGIFKQGSIFPTEGLIVKTTDGGANWTQTLIPVPPSYNWIGLNAVFFIDASKGIVVGGEGVIYETSDSGISWNSQASGTSYNLNRVCFTDDLNGWVAGDDGIILHTTNGGVSFVEEEQIDEMPTEFLLSQNYPNPFNPSTSIKYQVSNNSYVSLVVYDILGNELETLVNEEKQSGTYEVTWYAKQLPSGVYFYQMLVSALQSKDGKAGSFIETKKMLLIK